MYYIHSVLLQMKFYFHTVLTVVTPHTTILIMDYSKWVGY